MQISFFSGFYINITKTFNHIILYKKISFFFDELAMSQRCSAIFCATGAWGLTRKNDVGDISELGCCGLENSFYVRCCNLINVSFSVHQIFQIIRKFQLLATFTKLSEFCASWAAIQNSRVILISSFVKRFHNRRMDSSERSV